MKHYKYIGNDKDFVGHTALGREINGHFHIQIDNLEHYMSHGWYIANRLDWEDLPAEISLELLEKLKKIAVQPCLCDREDACVYDALGSNVDDCYQRGLDDGERLLAREIIAAIKNS